MRRLSKLNPLRAHLFSRLNLRMQRKPLSTSNQDTSNTNNVVTSWLKLADIFMKEGEVRSAEQIYKKVIELAPKTEPAYRQLWKSWAAHSALRVTQTEMDDFIEKYEQHIEADSQDGNAKVGRSSN